MFDGNEYLRRSRSRHQSSIRFVSFKAPGRFGKSRQPPPGQTCFKNNPNWTCFWELWNLRVTDSVLLKFPYEGDSRGKRSALTKREHFVPREQVNFSSHPNKTLVQHLTRIAHKNSITDGQRLFSFSFFVGEPVMSGERFWEFVWFNIQWRKFSNQSFSKNKSQAPVKSCLATP